ncbi:MAG: hypothetical protein JRF33_24580 [Deltaproteobacteria bacterium]|nr:hypothetical protein [Deltaproteobacteria bacterium]
MNRSTGSRGGLVAHLVWPLGGVLAGLLATGGLWWLRSLGESGRYLSMQAASDFVHRFTLIAAPVALIGLVLAWTLSEIGGMGGKLATCFHIAVALLLATLLGTTSHLLIFDLSLEQAGRAGQWLQPPKEAWDLDPEQGQWNETSAGLPNLQTEALLQGAVLTLDRRSLALKLPSGGFRWSRPRPGPPPAHLLLSAGQIIYAGPGGAFEDDVVVLAVDLASGRRLWEFHVLGRSVKHLGIEASRPLVEIWRPASTLRYLLDWPRARVIASTGEVAAERRTNQHLRKPPGASQGAQGPQKVP